MEKVEILNESSQADLEPASGALEALRRSNYPDLRKLSIDESTESVVILGRVTSYFLKQLAQDTVMPYRKRRALVNRVMVKTTRLADKNAKALAEVGLELEQFLAIPQRAHLGLAGRTARRIEPLIHSLWPDLSEIRAKEIDGSIQIAERLAAGAKSFSADEEGAPFAVLAALNARETLWADANVKHAVCAAVQAVVDTAYVTRFAVADNPQAVVRATASVLKDAVTAGRCSGFENDIILAIHRDFKKLFQAFREGSLNAETPISSDFFGAQWSQGAPEGWPSLEPESKLLVDGRNKELERFLRMFLRSSSLAFPGLPQNLGTAIETDREVVNAFSSESFECLPLAVKLLIVLRFMNSDSEELRMTSLAVLRFSMPIDHCWIAYEALRECLGGPGRQNPQVRIDRIVDFCQNVARIWNVLLAFRKRAMPGNGSPQPESDRLLGPAEDLAAEAWEALRHKPLKSSKERFTDLVRKGWINSRGQVTTLLGGTADPEPNCATWSDTGNS